MPQYRKFNLLTYWSRSLRNDNHESEDCLSFRRDELSENDNNDDGGEIGINISFKVDNSNRDFNSGFYEIFRVSSFLGEEKREKVDNIDICYGLDDTSEIRDLAKWLMREADEIDKEKEISENRR